jgi:hypothetical protein
MSFKLIPMQGNTSELKSDLESPPTHPREEEVIPVIKQAIDEIVEALGGYLSISCNGNINHVGGESGDVINIYITSLPAPAVATSTSVENEQVQPSAVTPIQREIAPKGEIQTGEPVPVTEGTGQLQPQLPTNWQEAEAEAPSVNKENPSTEPPTTPENSAEKAPEVPAVTPPGQAEAQEIAQATLPPAEPA